MTTPSSSPKDRAFPLKRKDSYETDCHGAHDRRGAHPCQEDSCSAPAPRGSGGQDQQSDAADRKARLHGRVHLHPGAERNVAENGGYEQGASTIAAALVEAEQLLLHRPHHHAEQDSGSRVRLRIVALASRLAKLVKVFALQRPRGRCPVLVGANADKRIMVSSVHPNALFSFPSSNTRYNFSWFHQSSDRTSTRKCPARR